MNPVFTLRVTKGNDKRKSIDFDLSLFHEKKWRQKNPSKIWCQILLANANLNGLVIDNNQSRTSSEHFDPPLFQNPYKIMAEAESNLMLTLKQADFQLEYKARVDSLCLILGQTLTGS